MLNTQVEGQGPTLIWGHGLQGSIAHENACGLFHTTLPAMRRIRFDARGHGLSAAAGSDADYRWGNLGADMLAVADEHANAGRFALGGQSMGCASALHAALKVPGKASCLVLVIPPTAWETRPAQVDKYRRAVQLLERRGMPAFLQATRQFPALPAWLRSDHPHLEAARLKTLEEFTAERLIPILQGAAASDLPPPQRLKELNMPCLILAWTEDETHPTTTALKLAETLPQAQLQIAKDSQAVARWPALIEDFVVNSAKPVEGDH